MDIAGAAVIVAGGAGNLGSAIVAELLRRGARVGVIDAAEPPAFEGDVAFVRGDVADDAEAAAALQSLAGRIGGVSALVNCTGLIHSEPLVNILDPQQRRHRLSTWDAVIRGNLTATFLLSAYVAEHMVASKTKGVIVNFSSIAAGGNAGQTAYAAAKAGVEAMTNVWARELGPMGIRVVAIAPGFVDTPSTRSAMKENALNDLRRRTPLRRLATADEIARAVVCAIENDFMTGNVLAVDGGLTL
jgi:3-oxoacyl-[acyl-carrier protein] reductase